MILSHLADFWRLVRNEEDQDGFQKVFATKCVMLDAQGNLEGVIGLSGDKHGKTEGKELIVPMIKTTSDLDSVNFASASAPRVMGIFDPNGLPPDPKKLKNKMARIKEAPERFARLINEAAIHIAKGPIMAVDAFLSNDGAVKLRATNQFLVSDFVVFMVEGEYLCENEDVKRYYLDHIRGPALGGVGGICAVTGQATMLATLSVLDVKGVPGTRSSGAALISSNNASFQSYGCEYPPIGIEMSEHSTHALTFMLNSPHHSVRFGHVVYVFWAKNGAGLPEARSLNSDVAAVKSMFDSLKEGKEQLGFKTEQFYMASYSGDIARVIQRSFDTTTLYDVYGNIQRWFDIHGLELIGTKDRAPRDVLALTVRQFVQAIYPYSPTEKKRENDPADRLEPKVFHAILLGLPLPHELTYLGLERVIAMRGPWRRTESSLFLDERLVALLKAVFLSNRDNFNLYGNMKTMNKNETNPAYVCGRLLAVYDALQRKAIKSVNTTIADRYFSSAMRYPSRVFGAMASEARPHLRKLRENPDLKGAYWGFSGEINSLMDMLGELPSVFTADEQTLFVLGFYHQGASDRIAAQEAKAAQAQPSSEESNSSTTVSTTNASLI